MSDPNLKKTHTRLRRRVLLAVAVSAVVLVVLAGCPARTPPPTPTPTRTPRALGPTDTPVPPPTGTASFTSPLPTPESTLEPVETPTVSAPPTATASPEPTATPTPPATPFPPGPASKLGLFVSRNDPRIFDLLRTGNVAVVKTVEYDSNFVAEIKQVSPETLVVARLDLPQIDLSTLTDPEGAARRIRRQAAAHRHRAAPAGCDRRLGGVQRARGLGRRADGAAGALRGGAHASARRRRCPFSHRQLRGRAA